MHLKETVYDFVDWFHVTRDSDQWRALAHKVIKLPIP
jgi:hypothetical protein